VLANYDLAVSDPDGTGMDDTLTIERQIIEEGRMTVDLGGARARGTVAVNRQSKSREDLTSGGDVFGNDRIGNDAVDTEQLVDTAVIESKLADLSVSLQKIQDNAVIEGKLADLSVSENKIQDGSISTPKLIAEAVTANEIEADTITAAQIQSGTITTFEIKADTITAFNIAADTITADEVAADTITANEIDVLDLSTQQLEITSDDGETKIVFDIDDSGTFDDLILRRGGIGSGNFDIGTSNDPVATMTANSVIPPSDFNGQIGRPGDAYVGINAYNYNAAGGISGGISDEVIDVLEDHEDRLDALE